MKKEFTYYISFLLILIVFSSCSKERIENQNERIAAYLEENEITAEPRGSGLYYIEVEPEVPVADEASTPKKGDTLILSYSGYILVSATQYDVFDEKTSEDPGIYVYKTDNAIEGWEEGIGYMTEGDSAKLIIPYQLAYGKSRVGMIPPYSTLVFDVSIIEIR